MILQVQAQELVVMSKVAIVEDTIVSKAISISKKLSDSKVKSLLIFGGKISDVNNFTTIADNIKRLKKVYDKVYLIPGDTEWVFLGPEGIKELDNYLADQFSQDILIPDNACGELEIKEISDDWNLAAIDSKWYFSNWNNDNLFNRGCKIRDRNRFWIHIGEGLSKEKNKMLVFFTYHPPIRFDNSAGYLSWRDHLLPIPVASTIFHSIKCYSCSYEDANHPRYQKYSSQIKDAVNLEPNIITISAGGNYLMDHIVEDHHYLNINSSDQSEFISKKRVAWQSSKAAYLVLSEVEDGIKTDWYSMRNDHLIRSDIKLRNEEIIDTLSQVSYEYDKLRMDTVLAPVLTQGNITKLNGKLLGDLNTDFHYLPVKAPVLDLSTFESGLNPTSIEGGQQSLSVRLESKDGTEYIARTIERAVTKLVPPPFDLAPAKGLVRYYFTATNPFGFLVSSSLEASLDLYRTDPSLMYLPKQELLKPYNDEIGGKLVLMRASALGDNEETDLLANSKEIISSNHFIEEYLDNHAKPDASLYLKVRLLDMLINDWDRHENQWSWAKKSNSEGTVNTYYPIPKDRDEALSNYNGWLLSFTRQFVPLLFPLKPFDDELSTNDITWMHYVASYLDKLILTDLSKAEWDKVVNEFTTQINDASIVEAVNQLPGQLSVEVKEDIKAKLKQRLVDIDQTANIFYNLIRDEAVIFGSTKADSIVITNESNGAMVSVWSLDEKGNSYKKVQNFYENQQSKEIWIYTLDGDDQFHIDGEGTNKIKIRLMGGFGNDLYNVSNQNRHRVHIYDTPNNAEINTNADVVISFNNEIVSLNRKDFMQNYDWYLPVLNFNTDDGILMGLMHSWNSYGFKSKITQTVMASYGYLRNSSLLDYSIIFQNDLKKLDKFINLTYFGPRYEFNFFGFGNGIERDEDQPNEFYFVRQARATFDAGVVKPINDIASLALSIDASGTELQMVENRFLTQNTVETEIFDRQYFAGLKLQYQLKNFDSRLKPENGVSLISILNAQKHLNMGNRDFIRLDIEGTFFKSFGENSKVVFGTSVAYRKVLGNPFFYQAPFIGGDTGLRGFNRERFYGDESFSHKSDVYIHLTDRSWEQDKRNSWGISLSLDHGRVWSDQDVLDTWFINYGFGVFFSPLDVATINGGIFFSQDGNQRIQIGLGWPL